MTLGLLRFEEAYFARLWGGEKLRGLYGKNTPKDQVIGESWMISDHAEHESQAVPGSAEHSAFLG